MADYFPTKYDSARDEVIAYLADETEGYGTRDYSTGDVDAPTGWFALVEIPADVNLFHANEDDEASRVAREYNVSASDVAGIHIVTHNSQGFVSVETFPNEEAARYEFDRLSNEYAEWAGSDEESSIYVVDDPADRCPVDSEGLHRISYGSCDQCGAKNYA